MDADNHDVRTNLLIRNGSVLDGTGAPAVAADVRIRHGVIAEIGAGLDPDGEPEIDASGAYVTPGFIDIHTHFDPSLFWDPACDPMPQHGVTSLLFGNCSLSLAPVRAAQVPGLTDLFSYIEDIPASAFDMSIPWNWESYGEYIRELERRPYAVNVGGMVGHNLLRTFVMGDEAWERTATDAEREQIARLLGECLDGGAFAMSTSQGFDEDRNKRPVPSRLADDAELNALIDVLADRGRFVQFIADNHAKRTAGSVRRMAELCGRRGLTSTWINVAYYPDLPQFAIELLDLCAELQAAGSPCYPQVSPRPVDIQINWVGGMSLNTLATTWHPVVQETDPDRKREMLADPEWRIRARAEWDKVPFTMLQHRYPERVRFVSVTRPENERWLNHTLADLAAERGVHPSDALADWVLANDLRPGVVGTGVANGDPEGVAPLVTHPAGIFANSDAGAHQQMFSAAGDTTLMLTRYVRDRGDLTLEHAVHRMTGQLAERFGFAGRGVLRPGAAGDVAVFDLDELTWEPEVFVTDVPGDQRRLRRPQGGYRATVVAGSVVQLAGELTGQLPGRVLRHGVQSSDLVGSPA